MYLIKCLWLFSCLNIISCNILSAKRFCPSTLIYLTNKSLISIQQKTLPYKEPIISYEKLQYGILEVIGSELSIIEQNVCHFIEFILPYFNVSEICLKYFLFNEKNNYLFKLLSKLKIPLKTISLQTCYFADESQLPAINPLPCLETFRITECFMSNDDLCCVLNLFIKNVKSLRLTSIFKKPSLKSVISEELQFYSPFTEFELLPIRFDILSFSNDCLRNLTLKSLLLSDGIDLSQLPSVNFLEISKCDFKSPDSNYDIRLPESLKNIKDDSSLLFYEKNSSAFLQKRITIDNENPFCYVISHEIDSKILMFSSWILEFAAADEIAFVNFINFLSLNRLEFFHVKRIKLETDLSRISIIRMLQLVNSFPELETLCISITQISTEIVGIEELFANCSAGHLKKLELYFFSSQNTNEVQSRFVFEMIKFGPNLTSLTLFYHCSNSFILATNNLIRLHHLELYHLREISFIYDTNEPILLSNDLFLAFYYEVKSLEIRDDSYSLCVDDNVDSLNSFSIFSVEKLKLKMNVKSQNTAYFKLLFSKFPNLKEVVDLAVPFDLAVTLLATNMSTLTKVQCLTKFSVYAVDDLFNALSKNIVDLTIKCNESDKISMKRTFRHKFKHTSLSFC